MPMLDIINQIDAYLSSLGLARELLSKSLAGPQRKGVVKKRKKAKKTGPVVSTKSRVRTTSRAKILTAPRTGAKTRKASVANIPGSPAPQVEALAPLPMAISRTVPESLRLPNVDRVRLPYRGPRSAIRPSHTRNSKASEPTPRASLGSAKPAIALAGPVNSKIVVVSAEQARRDRERAVPSEIQPRSILGSGLTGRPAFEALFRDKSDRSR
jgi:hypothetical protein